MILWKLGKPEVWEHMIKERTRLFKERADAERAEEERKLAHKKKMADQFIFAMYFIAGSAIVFAIAAWVVLLSMGKWKKKEFMKKKLLNVI